MGKALSGEQFYTWTGLVFMALRCLFFPLLTTLKSRSILQDGILSLWIILEEKNRLIAELMELIDIIGVSCE